MGKLAADHGADLRNFARCAEPVEPGGERLLKRRRNGLQAPGLASLEQELCDLFDVQRHPAGALAHTLDQLFAQRMAIAELADHLRNVGAIKGTQRDNAMVGTQAPWWTEFWPCSRDDEQRGRPTALGQSLHQIE